MSRIFSIRPVAPEDAGAAPDGTRGFRELLRQLEEGRAPADDFAAPVRYTAQTEPALRRIAERYGFDRLPATWCELYALFEYCDSLDAASGAGMVDPAQRADWQNASFEVWRRKQPERMPAIEAFCRGDLDTLRELHRRDDTLTALGARYLSAS